MSGIKKPRKNTGRVSLVCTNCRKRKIKCDRKRPCWNCIKSSSINACVYENCEEQSPSDCYHHEGEEHCDGNMIGPSAKPSDSILDTKFKISKLRIIIQKPSNTHLRPFVFATGVKHHILSYRFLFSFKHLLDREKKLWKLKNTSINQLELSDFNYNYDPMYVNILNQKVEKLLCNNYNAISERLNHFRIKLNSTLFDSCIPMGIVQLIFQHYFTLKPTGAIFNYPQKKHEYSMIALIAAVVELSFIFTKYDNYNFNFPLLHKNNEFNDLAILLLNASCFRKKRSLFSVYTLLILRLSLMVYGDRQSNQGLYQDSHFLFSNAVNLCKEMGVHTNQDTSHYVDGLNKDKDYRSISFGKEISIENIKKLWNYLLKVDCFYFIEASIPPIIDNRYCQGYYGDIYGASREIGQFVSLVPEIALDLMGNTTITLNKLLDSTSQIINLLSQLPSIDDLGAIEKKEDEWKLYELKFKVLFLLFTCLNQMNSILDNEGLSIMFSKETLQNVQNKAIIQALKHECYTKCKLIYIITLNHILQISKKPSCSKFIFYIKWDIASWVGMKSIFFLDLYISKKSDEKKLPKATSPSNKNDNNFFKLPDAPTFDSIQLEEMLYNFNTTKYFKIFAEFEDAFKVELLASFLTDFYENILNLEVCFSDFNMYVMTKLFLFTLYFLYSYITYYQEPGFNIIESFDKVRNITQSVISKFLQQGKLPHLLPPYQIMAAADNGVVDVDTDYTDNNTVSDSIPIPTPQSKEVGDTMNLPPLLSPVNTLNRPFSQFDDIASSIFKDESMVSFFNEINDFFNNGLE